ncbi:MAG: hypothetical protein LLG45_13295 [Actinomycetia bacterium]|nr:hypothetical protein [Actinomycetes bacterium]
MNARGRVYCNLKVFRIDAHGRGRLVREAHNAVLTRGLNQLRDAMRGEAFHLSYIGLGSSGTAVSASQTWGLSPLMISQATNRSAKGARLRTTQQIMEDELNGSTIREVWISMSADAPPTGPGAFARVVIDPLEKTSEFRYVFQFDVVFGGTNSRLACNMMAALAASTGDFTIRIASLMCGRGTAPESIADTGLADPWTMTPIAVASSSVADGELTLFFTLPPDQYNDLVLAEGGVYFDVASGSSPLSVPALFARGLVQPGPFAIEVGKGAQVVVQLRWESG